MIKNLVEKHAWVMWLGGSLSFVDITLFNWEFYVILIPVIILEIISQNRFE